VSAHAAVAALEPPRELQLWRREVERLMEPGDPLPPAVRDMVCAVLLSLAVDPASDRGTRRDTRRLLEIVDPTGVPTLEVVS
jgi:hypothetical protein